MEDTLKQMRYDPTVRKLVTAAVGLIVIIALVRIAQRSVGRYIQAT